MRFCMIYHVKYLSAGSLKVGFGTYMGYIYIYVYIYRERERDRQREDQPSRSFGAQIVASRAAGRRTQYRNEGSLTATSWRAPVFKR